MKSMVSDLVEDVRSSKKKAKIAVTNTAIPKRKVAPAKDKVNKKACPKCKKGELLRGKTGYGCSRWQAGCKFLLPFVFMKKKLPEKQLVRLMEYGSTIQLKGFKQDKKSLTGKVKINEEGEVIFVEKKAKATTVVEPIVASKTELKSTPISTPKTVVKEVVKQVKKTAATEMPLCPKCAKGRIVRGKTAYGCTDWKAGCDFRFFFADLRAKAGTRKLTKELVLEILQG